MKTRKAPRDVDAYIAAFPPEVQGVLERVRRLVRKALPRAVETISYGMPAYEVDGRIVIYVAGWKAHYSLYPVSERLVAEARMDLASTASVQAVPSRITPSGKGTVRFPLSEPVPAALLTAIVKARVMEAAVPAPATAAAKRKRPSPRRATR